MKKIIALVKYFRVYLSDWSEYNIPAKSPRSTCIISHRFGGRNGGIFVQFQGIW